ncbi:MAG: transporter related protein, partial [Enterovirga sp.]|nr:transporter related protein [Enterovirga sp.]
CADRLWLVERGTVDAFDGDMDDYRRYVLSGGQKKPARQAEEPPSPAGDRRAGADKRKAAEPLKKQLGTVEARIDRLSGVIAKVDAALADGSAYAADKKKARELAKMRDDAAKALAAAEEDWLRLTAELEAVG